jgi:hypothetical protein
MHSQNHHQLITSLIGRVQHITEVQAQGLHHVHILLLHQVQATTEVARQHAVVAVEVITAAEVVAEVAVHTLPAVRVVRVRVEAQAEVQAEAADVQEAAVALHQAAVNF